MLPSVMPEEDPGGQWYGGQSSVDQVHYILEVALSRLQLLLIEKHALEGSKDQLHWCHIVSMG